MIYKIHAVSATLNTKVAHLEYYGLVGECNGNTDEQDNSAAKDAEDFAAELNSIGHLGAGDWVGRVDPA